MKTQAKRDGIEIAKSKVTASGFNLVFLEEGEAEEGRSITYKLPDFKGMKIIIEDIEDYEVWTISLQSPNENNVIEFWGVYEYEEDFNDALEIMFKHAHKWDRNEVKS